MSLKPSTTSKPLQTSKNQKPEIIDPAAISKRLETATKNICKEIGGVAKSFYKIGYELYKVSEEKLYIAQNFKSVAEYGEKILGFQKSSVANYISICERLGVKKNDNPTAQLLPEFANFSYGQLTLMLALPAEEYSKITPDKTCSEIRKIKKSVKSSGSSGSSGSPAPAVPAVPSTPSAPATPSAQNREVYTISWLCDGDLFKSADITVLKDDNRAVRKELAVLFNNMWFDFGRNGDTLTIVLRGAVQ